MGMAGLALLALAGCVEDTGSADVMGIRTAPASDEGTCLNAVAAQTGNSVAVLQSTTSEANNEVIIGVGPEQARWQCLINRGVVVQIMSLTDEGAL
jgi:hypothetical protein